MSVRTDHVPVERLAAMALVARAPASEPDEHVLFHVSECDHCAAELSRLTADAEEWRDAARAQADTLFDDARLEAQRNRILDRLATLGQVARVLPFPRQSRDVVMPVSTTSRRWISVAAAAGLIIGLVAGQLLHLAPLDSLARRDAALTLPASRPATGPVRAVAATETLPSEDQFLDEIEATVQLRRAHSLRALDALTPTAGDFIDLPRGPR